MRKSSSRPLKLWVVAGETSGDNHGGELLRGLRSRLPNLQMEGIGGEKMQAQGMVLWRDLESMRAYGLMELVRHLPRLMLIMRRLRMVLKERQPDALLLIDYSGFNLRLAKRAKRLGIPVFYYVGPQLWATRAGRLRQVQKSVRLIILILPFEKDIYLKAGVRAYFFGHPLVGQVPSSQEKKLLQQRLSGWQGEIIAIIPGSRAEELLRHLHPLLDATQLLIKNGIKARFVIPLSDNLNQPKIKKLIHAAIAKRGIAKHLLVVEKCFLAVIHRAQLAAVCSGTAAFQTALANVPMVLFYRLNPITFWILKKLLLIPYAALVNITAGRMVIPELIQKQCTAENIYQQLKKLHPLPQRKLMQKQLKIITSKFGKPSAYQRAAELIAEELQNL